MAGLIRQGHFLGTKLRSLRKRNGLTLDELSARCVQIDAAGAPSVSYLSMVETGKRMPSTEMLQMLAGIFSKDARWFLDENTDVETAPAPRQPVFLPTAPVREIAMRISSPPKAACRAISSASVSSVTALTTSRPPGRSAATAASSTPGSLAPPPMKMAFGGGKLVNAAGADAWTTSSPGTPKAAALR